MISDYMALHRCYALRNALAITFTLLERRSDVCSQPPQPLSRQFGLRKFARELREELQTATADIHYSFRLKFSSWVPYEFPMKIWCGGLY